MARLLKYSASSYGPLQNNGKHKLAQSHALCIYPSDAICSFIPKNACSTLRTSIAIANGCIEGEEDFNWIHKNNTSFSASMSELAKAKYTFTILRCPYARIASAYLDKIVGKTSTVWTLYDLMNRSFDPDTISFAEFISYVTLSHVVRGDIHWRGQCDFLVYKDYDDYFSMSEMPHALETLKRKISLDVIDARKLTNHGVDGLELVDDQCYADTPAYKIAQMKRDGYSPAPASLFNDALIEDVKQHYKHDFALYQEKFGDAGLLFSEPEALRTGSTG